MVRQTIRFTAALALAACMAVPAAAQQRDRLSGEVLAKKQADVRGAQQPYTVVLVDTDRGRMAVDLGPMRNLRNADIDTGERITVEGDIVRMGDRPLLIASQLRIDGEQFRIRRDQQTQQQARRDQQGRQGQQQARRDPQRQRGQQQRQQMAWRPQGRDQISGEIVSTKQADVRGAQEPYFVALVETNRGQRIAVDLGPTSQARRNRLSEGDRISAEGRIVRVGDRPLLVAQQIEVDGQQFDVRRAWEGRQQQQQRQRDQQVRQIRGELASKKTARLPGTDKRFVLAKIETQDGQSVTANLGAQQTLNRLNLSEGDRVSVRGHRVRIHGEPILIAHELEHNGRRVFLDHQSLRRDRGTRQIQGEITGLNQIQAPGADAEELFAQIETRDGQKIVADLGSVRRLGRLDLQEGDRVTVVGRTVQIHDRPLFVAHELRHNNERVELDHREMHGERQMPQVRQISGELLRKKTVSPPGVDARFVLAEIETRDGRRVTATLGSAGKVQNLDLQEGDRIALRGHASPIHGDRLFIAHELEHQDQRVSLDHRDTQRGQQRRQISGELAATRRVSPPGIDAEFLLAQIETQQGQRVVANLGPTDKLRQLNLQEGDRVTVQGRTVQVHDRPLLVADRVSHDGQTVRLDQQRQQQQRREMAYRPERDRERQQRQRERDQQRGQRDVPGGLGVVVERDRDAEGVLVTRVHRDSPADQAGIRPGDHIILIDQNYIDNPTEVAETIADHDPGDRVRIVFSRSGQERSTTAELEPRLEALNYER